MSASQMALKLATLSALALCCLLSAGSAAAKPSTMCHANEAPCAAKNLFNTTERLHGVVAESLAGTSASFTGSLGVLSCTHGKFVTEFPKAIEGEPIPSSTWTFLDTCSYLGSSCQVESATVPSSVVAIGGGDGNLTVAEPVLQAICGFGKCTYGAASIESLVDGGAPAATLRLERALSRLAGSPLVCPAAMTYGATFQETEGAVGTFVTQ